MKKFVLIYYSGDSTHFIPLEAKDRAEAAEDAIGQCSFPVRNALIEVSEEDFLKLTPFFRI